MKTLLAKFIDHIICFFTAFITGVRPQRLPENPIPTVYYANHHSHGDFILVWISLPQNLRLCTRPVAGADYWQQGRIRRFIANAVFNVLLVDRNSENPQQAIETMSNAIRKGENLIIFPEGTRNLGEEPLQPFKSGIYHLAKQQPNIQFVPVWIDNMKQVLPKGAILPIPLMCQARFGDPISLQDGEEKADFIERSRQALLALSPINKE